MVLAFRRLLPFAAVTASLPTSVVSLHTGAYRSSYPSRFATAVAVVVSRTFTVAETFVTKHSSTASSTFSATALRSMSVDSATEPPPVVVPGRPTWQQTMLRIADPAKSLPFYTDLLGMTLIDKLDFPQFKFTLYFLTTIPDGETYNLTPGTKEAHDYLWSMEGVALELTHNHGTESGADGFTGYHVGNGEKDGYGHIAVNVNDVYATCDRLEKAGCSFKKKPDEGRMKGLAFVYDPDGYWVEIVKRSDDAKIQNECNFSQTMLRVKDPKKTIAFYKSFGMKLLVERHLDGFSLFFLGSSNVPDDVNVKELFQPVLELTHNHGTESDDNFKHYNGNEEGRQGFGHIGFLVDDVYDACDEIRKMGYGFRKEPDAGSMKGLAFAYDPDGYSVEIIKRGGIEFGDKKVEK